MNNLNLLQNIKFQNKNYVNTLTIKVVELEIKNIIIDVKLN